MSERRLAFNFDHPLAIEAVLTAHLKSPGAALRADFKDDAVWSRSIEQLRKIRNLGPDWDGQGADAPNLEIVDSALDYLDVLRANRCPVPPTRIVVAPDGTVLFEWQIDDWYVEADITEPYHADWMLMRRGADAEHRATSWAPLAR